MSVWEGAGVRLDITFRNPKTRKIEDPDGDVAVTLKKPDNSTSTVGATKVKDGVYLAEFVADQPGEWEWRASSDGAMPGVQEGTLTVRESTVD